MSSRLAARRQRRNGAIGVSVLAHVVVFAIRGQNAAKLIAPEPLRSQTTTLWLMPHLTPMEHESKARQVAASAATALPSGSPANKSLAKALATAAVSNPASIAPQAAQAGGGEALPSTVGSGAGTGLQGALRTSVGCDMGHLAHLTPEERDRCNQHMGEEAKRGPKFIDTIPPEKREYYDAVQQAYQAAHDPMHPLVRDRYGNVQPWGKGPGVGCGMKFGGPPQPPDHRSLTDKIKATGLLGFDLGPLKCGIVIPQGSMTPEIGIAVP